MLRTAQKMMVGFLTMGLLVALTACMGAWFTPQQKATLIIGQPVITGNRGEVRISVVNMPDGGVAGIKLGKVNDEAITFSDIDAASIVATGLNGFTVLAQDFTTNAGKGCLLGANASTGITGGKILKITFETTGVNPTFTIPQANKVKLKLSSDLNTWITLQKLEAGKAYYAK